MFKESGTMYTVCIKKSMVQICLHESLCDSKIDMSSSLLLSSLPYKEHVLRKTVKLFEFLHFKS